MKFSHAFIAGLTCFGCLGPAAGSPTISVNAAAVWDENITRCPYDGGIRDAALFDANGSATWHRQLDRDVSLTFDANAGLETCPEYDGLDHGLVGLQVAARRKFGLGPFAPALRADLSYTGSWYRESIRTGTRFLAGLSWSKRWREDTETVLAAEYLQNDGHAAAFDYHNFGLSFETRYDLSERWQLTVGLRRQWGEQVTYAWLGGGGASYPYAYDTWKGTTDVETYGKNWYAYTIDAHADSVWIVIAPALGANCSLPLRYEEIAVVGSGESYRCRLFTLSFVQRF